MVVAGWGDTTDSEQTSVFPTILQYAWLPTVSDDHCRATFRLYMGEYSYGSSRADTMDFETMLCVGYLDLSDSLSVAGSCQGDSGGPLLLSDDDDTWTQIGIVSWGFGCADLYGVSSDVTIFEDFIESTLYGASYAPTSVVDYAPTHQIADYHTESSQPVSPPTTPTPASQPTSRSLPAWPTSPSYSPTKQAMEVTGSMIVDNISLEDAEDHLDVFASAVATVAQVDVSAVVVIATLTRKRREEVTISYVISVAGDEVGAVTETLRAADLADYESALATAATDFGVTELFESLEMVDIVTGETTNARGHRSNSKNNNETSIVFLIIVIACIFLCFYAFLFFVMARTKKRQDESRTTRAPPDDDVLSSHRTLAREPSAPPLDVPEARMVSSSSFAPLARAQVIPRSS